uniref:Ig-like domain-containing protein n=1 Tax=Periophthalmus magnuspinnatus TaxID=409849 RepID=A0A3B4AIK4_9GOBI
QVQCILLMKLLCITSGFLSYTCSQFTTTEVQRGADVTLNCTITLVFPAHFSWFHMNDQHNASQICSMLHSRGNVTFHRAAQKEKYTMTLNTSMTYLTIKTVDDSDYGLYFCGEKMKYKSVIFTAVFLKIQGIRVILHVFCDLFVLSF